MLDQGLWLNIKKEKGKQPEVSRVMFGIQLNGVDFKPLVVNFTQSQKRHTVCLGTENGVLQPFHLMSKVES